PTPGELSDAQDQVRKAQAALDNARNGQPSTTADANQVDFAALQNAVAQDQATVDGLQQTLDATQMRAPFDGTVVSVRVKAGDSITSAKPVFMLARPGPRIVRVDLADDQVPLLSVGQQAVIGQDGSDSSAPPIDATVLGVTKASADGTRAASADLQVSWPDGQQPKFGAPVQVRLTLQHKDDVLVVPVRALHQVGGKATVEVLNGTLRRLVNVQVGIKTDTSAEIVSGLTEGQMVLVGPG
ncbi:MAG TPA: efflux RND transporter periplasmic adaptor subunit, partial [Chloroflexota bacterium]